MIKSMLVGLDGTRDGDAARDWAIARASETGAVLTALAVIDEPGIRAIEPHHPVGGTPGIDPVFYLGYEAQLANVRTQAEHRLADFTARCARLGLVHQTIVHAGSPSRWILDESAAHDLIVLGKQTRFRFTGHERPDETAQEVLKGSARPVVVVPAPAGDIPSVLIAYDGSLQAVRTLAAFVAVAPCKLGAVHLVNVTEDEPAATIDLERARRFLAFHEVEASLHILPSSGPPADLILGHADRLGAGLLVMGAYGQPVMREFFLGSMTRTVLHETKIPLFLDC